MSGFGTTFGEHFGGLPGERWTLHVETADGTDTIVVSGLQAETPTVTDGAEVETTLAFFRDGREDTDGPHTERYRALWPWMDVNASEVVRYGTDARGRPWFRERYATDSPVESVLVGVNPGGDIVDARGWWGLLVGLEDASVPKESGRGHRRLEATWFVLGRFSEYTSHDDVRTAFADEVI